MIWFSKSNISQYLELDTDPGNKMILSITSIFVKMYFWKVFECDTVIIVTLLSWIKVVPCSCHFTILQLQVSKFWTLLFWFDNDTRWSLAALQYETCQQYDNDIYQQFCDWFFGICVSFLPLLQSLRTSPGSRIFNQDLGLP